jgi:hypothetical protein
MFKPCLVCGHKPSHAAPVLPYEQGGIMHKHNLFPLCTKHLMRVDQIGIVKFCKEHWRVKEELTSKGWAITDEKAINPFFIITEEQ